MVKLARDRKSRGEVRDWLEKGVFAAGWVLVLAATSPIVLAADKMPDSSHTSRRVELIREAGGRVSPASDGLYVVDWGGPGASSDEPSAVDVDVSLLKRRNQLGGVYLSNRPVTDRSKEIVAGWPRLEHLYLSASKVSDDSMRHLSRLTQLRTLYLNHTSVTDLGVARPAELDQIEVLYLHNTRVTDASLRTLSRFPQLKKLHVYRSAISPRGVDWLRDELPGVEVK